MSFLDVAAAANLPADTIRGFEAGTRHPSTRELAQVSEALGVPPLILLGDDTRALERALATPDSALARNAHALNVLFGATQQTGPRP